MRMNKKNTEKLFNDFPEFFKHKDNLRASLMAFGFECGNGWFDLIYNLCIDIKKYFLNEYEGIGYNNEKYYHEIPEHFNVLQVKEKFGGLRFYISSAPQYVHDIIREAELKSFHICEECGKENPEYKKGDKKYKSFHRDRLPWVLTLCDDCLKKHCKERNIPFKQYVSPWQKKNKSPYKIIQ